MRLLVDCTPLATGGGVQVAIAFLDNLRRQDEVAWQAAVPAPLRAVLPAPMQGDGRIVFFPKRTLLDRFRIGHALRRMERQFSPHVVFTVFGPAYFRARVPHAVGFALGNLLHEPARRLPGVTGLRDMALNALRRRLLRRSDRFIVETEPVRDRLADFLGIDPARIAVIGNSVNPVLARPLETARPPDRFSFLIPSAYYQHKNLEVVPAVAAAMQRLDPRLDFEFRFTLAADSRPWREITTKAVRLGVDDRLVTLGVVAIADLSPAYGEASAVFLPTLRETSSAVYPESFFFRRPLVTSDRDFAHELCGDAALFVPPLDPEAIAAALVGLARSPATRARLVAAGERQLTEAYPTPEAKFAMQMALLKAVAEDMPAPVVAQQTPTCVAAPPAEDASRSRSVRFHDELAAAWDRKYQSGRFRRRAKFIADSVMPAILRPGPWLDAGSGSGYFSRALADLGLRVSGVDASPAMLRAATDLAARSGLAGLLRFQLIANVEHLPFADGSFAGCICFSVLEYLDHPYRCLDELARVLAPGGALALSVPHAASPVRWAQRLAGPLMPRGGSSRQRYRALSRFAATRRGLRDALRLRGLDVEGIIAFDAMVPAPLRRRVPPSLMFAIAFKPYADTRESVASDVPVARGPPVAVAARPLVLDDARAPGGG